MFSIWRFCKAVYIVKLDFVEEAEAKASSQHFQIQEITVEPSWKAPFVLIGGGSDEDVERGAEEGQTIEIRASGVEVDEEAHEINASGARTSN